jgi:hypothetical protein
MAQIVVASAVASFLLAIVFASCLWGIGKLAWRSLRRQSP